MNNNLALCALHALSRLSFFQIAFSIIATTMFASSCTSAMADAVCSEIRSDIYSFTKTRDELIKEYPGTFLTMIGCVVAGKEMDASPLGTLATCVAACAILVTLDDCKNAGLGVISLAQTRQRLLKANREFSCGVNVPDI